MAWADSSKEVQELETIVEVSRTLLKFRKNEFTLKY
jgi:hypothetical protein